MPVKPMTVVPFLTVDEAKAALGIEGRLCPTVRVCLECGQPARTPAGQHVCLWCLVSKLWGQPVYPRKRMAHE